jgi:periplasmic divalent cation tolerance protein
MAEECCVVFVTVGKREEAEKIADALVAERLAACCNLVPSVKSIYRWKGEICRDEETLMVIKTRRERFEALRARVKALHSYAVPEIVALPIIAGHADYLDWVCEETTA